MIGAAVRSVIERFLMSETPEVLSIKGAWGVGKTYAWNKLVLDSKASIKLPDYCYVSLFGMNSIADLRMAIFANTRAAKDLGTPLTVDTVMQSWRSQGGALLKRALAFRSV